MTLPTLTRPVRFVLAGGWNTAFGYGVYIALVFALRGLAMSETARATTALSIAYVISVMQAFVCYKYFVFGGGTEVVREFAKFSMVYVATFVFNLLTLPPLVRFTPLGPVLAQGLIVVVSAAASYVFHSQFSFRRRGANP